MTVVRWRGRAVPGRGLGSRVVVSQDCRWHLPRIEGANLVFTDEDVSRVHADMVAAAGAKNIWLVGGGNLVAQFAERDLLDEIRVSLAPVTLGAGAPLLPWHITPMTLESVQGARGGSFVHLVYRVDDIACDQNDVHSRRR